MICLSKSKVAPGPSSTRTFGERSYVQVRRRFECHKNTPAANVRRTFGKKRSPNVPHTFSEPSKETPPDVQIMFYELDRSNSGRSKGWGVI